MIRLCLPPPITCMHSVKLRVRYVSFVDILLPSRPLRVRMNELCSKRTVLTSSYKCLRSITTKSDRRIVQPSARRLTLRTNTENILQCLLSSMETVEPPSDHSSMQCSQRLVHTTANHTQTLFQSSYISVNTQSPIRSTTNLVNCCTRMPIRLCEVFFSA